MEKHLICRLLTLKGMDSIRPVLRELGLEEERLREFLSPSRPHNLAFVAEWDGEVAGFLYGYRLLALNAPPQLFIYSVDVLERFQNRGIGSRLFQYVVDYSREQGDSECYVITERSNPRACRVYEKAGGKSEHGDEVVYVIDHRGTD